MAKASRWLPIFEAFVRDLRIASKEVTSTDERGVKLELWESQKRFLKEIATGLDDDIRTFICLKSRQLGITTISLAIDVFWLAMHPNLIGALVSDTDKNRNKNRAQIERYVKSLPDGYFGETFAIVKSNINFTQFSNGSRIDYLVAGTKNKGTSWGEGEGYAFAHLTEVASYGDPQGLASFEESFAQTNPDRLFIYESTAKGFNHFHEKYSKSKEEQFTKKAFFIGWWASNVNRIEKRDPRFQKFGTYKPTGDERDLVLMVQTLYGYKIQPEQLAWIRWKPTDTSADDPNLLDQNQPWVEKQAFIMTGHSFFQTRVIAQDMRLLEESDILFKPYMYEYGNDFFQFKMCRVEDESERHLIELKVWEEPLDGAQYVIGADPAYGRNDHKDRHCLDQDTEILTQGGWKRYENIAVGDLAVCFELETGQYSYGAISDKIVKHHSGEMHHFTSKGLDCLATPEHRVVSRNYRVLRNGEKQTWRFYTAREIASAGRSVREIPVGGSPIGDGIDGLSLDMCRALGWILTDGHAINAPYVGDGSRRGKKKKRTAYSIGQALTTEKMGIRVADEMVRVMTKLCPSATVKYHHRPNGGKRSPHVSIAIGVRESEQFAVWLGKYADRVPRAILENGSKDQIEAIFQGILEGDGGWDRNQNAWVKVCPGLNKFFSDDIQELAAKLGYSPSIAVQGPGSKGKFDQYLVRLSVRDSHTFEATNVKAVQYSGPVWCVTVPTGAFVARRNGKMFVTGNCASVWRCYADRIVQVAEFATADVEVKHFAWVLAHMASAYRDCIVNLEIGGPGRMIMMEWDHIRGLLKAEMYAQQVRQMGWDDAMDNARWYLYNRPDSPGAGYCYNFQTDFRSKYEIMHQMRGAYATRELGINSMYLLDEMANVVQDGSKIGAPESRSEKCKDDRVFACALAIRAWISWKRAAMMSEGLTFSRVNDRETGQTSTISNRLNEQVFRFFKRKDDQEDIEPDRGPKWMVDRGLM